MHSASLTKTAACTMLFFYNFCSGCKVFGKLFYLKYSQTSIFQLLILISSLKVWAHKLYKNRNENWKKLAVCSVLGPLRVLPLGDFVYICLHCGRVETWLINATEFFCHANQNCIINTGSDASDTVCTYLEFTSVLE